MSNSCGKNGRLLHRLDLAIVLVILCTTLSATPIAARQSSQEPVKKIELLSYEGDKISSIELAGQPDLKPDEWMPLVALHVGENFSISNVDQTLAALRGAGKFKDVELDIRPEQDGIRVIFVLQPAVYFGIYQFPGAERFSYSRLILASNYAPQEPYSPIDIQKARDSLTTFLQRNGYFQAEVNPDVEFDRPNNLANVNFRVTLNRLAKFGDILIEGAMPDESDHLRTALRSLRARLKTAAIREGKDYSLSTLQNATQFLESHLQSENHLGAQ